MFTLFVIFVFVWLFVKSVGLAFHVTWGLAKIAATLLFVIALPLLVVFFLVQKRFVEGIAMTGMK